MIWEQVGSIIEAHLILFRTLAVSPLSLESPGQSVDEHVAGQGEHTYPAVPRS